MRHTGIVSILPTVGMKLFDFYKTILLYNMNKE